MNNINNIFNNPLLKGDFRTDFNCSGNMNDYRDSGLFSGYKMDNAPVANTWFTWINFQHNHNPSYMVQAGFSYNSLNLYARQYIDGSWSTWRKI